MNSLSLPMGFIGGLLGALLTDFIRGPWKEFRNRRRAIRHDVIVFGNLGAPDPGWVMKAYPSTEADNPMRRHLAAQDTFRAHAAWMRAFAETEPLATRIVCWLGYRPVEASLGLMGLSNTMIAPTQERVPHRRQVNNALKLPD